MVDSDKDVVLSSTPVTNHIVFFDLWLDCMLLLASIAGLAKGRDMTIVTGVMSLPLRHLVAMAQSFATLDILCCGNLIVGVGARFHEIGFPRFGYPIRSAAQDTERWHRRSESVTQRTNRHPPR